jgi:hypothetical protein
MFRFGFIPASAELSVRRVHCRHNVLLGDDSPEQTGEGRSLRIGQRGTQIGLKPKCQLSDAPQGLKTGLREVYLVATPIR